MTSVPTLAEFLGTAREAFSFLHRFGFTEVPAARHIGDPFQVWFGADRRCVVVAGEGYGTMASVRLEHDGLELDVIYLVPVAERPAPVRKGPRGQLDQIREAARSLEQHGSDFLRGDLERFLKLAKPLPPYKQPGA